MDSPALIPISAVVDSYLNVTGNYSDAMFRRLLQVVCENYTHLNINSTSIFQTLRTTVGRTNIVAVPSDYIDYVRIGVPVHGEIYTLTKNDKILLPTLMSCGEDVKDPGSSSYTEKPWYPSFSSSGGRNFLYYNYDKKARAIVFKGDAVGREVVIQYISSGVSMDGDTLIPVQLLLTMRAFLHWTLLSFDVKMPEVKVVAAKRTFYELLAEYERMDMSFTADEFIDAIRQGYKQTIKS